MGRTHHRGRIQSARAARRAKFARGLKTRQQKALPWLRCVDRRSLLAGTALASTLLLGSLIAPTPASAFTCAGDVGTGPAPINHTGINDFIICVNTEARTNAAGYTIALTTLNANHFIDLYTTGSLTSANVGNAFGIFAATNGSNSPVSIESLGDITATSSAIRAAGFFVVTNNGNSPIDIVNSGDITANAAADDAYGIFARASGVNSPVAIENSGNITAIAGGLEAFGILARTDAGNSPVSVINSGNITAKSGSDEAFGIYAFTDVGNSPISIENSGNIAVTGLLNAYGLFADTFFGSSSPVNIVNSGDITASASDNVRGINARTDGAGSPIAINNSGDIGVTAEENAFGIYARTFEPGSAVSIVNSGDVFATATGLFSDATGIFARTDGVTNSPIEIDNGGDITALATVEALGILGETRPDNSPLSIVNSGDITTSASGATLEPLNGGVFGDTFGLNSPLSLVNSGNITSSADVNLVFGIYVDTRDDGGPLSIVNSGDIVVTVGNALGARAIGINAFTGGAGSPLSIVNSGKVTASGGAYAFGIEARTFGPNSPISIVNSGTVDPNIGIDAYTRGLYSTITINNSGSVGGGDAGIVAFSKYTTTTIINSGKITAKSLLAIDVDGGTATILNRGLILGFVDLTDNGDLFINQKSGVFETKLTSYFGLGDDLFRNEQGGTVLAATDPSVKETSGFEGLERFDSQGLITLQDRAVGDVFRISNTYGGTDLAFNGSGKSELAIDAFLGGPGSEADNFIIDGSVSGKTKVDVFNTNPGPGVFNKQGIPVVYVNGATPNGNEFFLSHPIDTGFFNYDLFFRPTGSGIFELRSFLGAGAFVLPQLITAAQDQWHSGSSTWFDRTADLRVLLNGGVAPAEDPNAKYAEGTPASPNITPAVWARGAGNWLNRDDTEHVTAFGRNYQYNLNRDLETVDFQSGIDLGKRGLLVDNDILVFGALGGYIHSDLDYDAINRLFDFNGGQVGGYATYLRGGLFVDTLVNVHLLEIDTRTLGFPNSMNATTVGVRTDSGYRFGSFHGGAFIEPLATISAIWADIDGFSQGGNKVSFNDDANVQGRLGLRVGTTTQLGYGISMEPFVIGSLWGNLSNDNQATLVSTGTSFILKDNLEDVWGEVSGGVNFFNPTASTAVFAKVDVTFGEDIDGVGGKAGIRVSW